MLEENNLKVRVKITMTHSITGETRTEEVGATIIGNRTMFDRNITVLPDEFYEFEIIDKDK